MARGEQVGKKEKGVRTAGLIKKNKKLKKYTDKVYQRFIIIVFNIKKYIGKVNQGLIKKKCIDKLNFVCQ